MHSGHEPDMPTACKYLPLCCVETVLDTSLSRIELILKATKICCVSCPINLKVQQGFKKHYSNCYQSQKQRDKACRGRTNTVRLAKVSSISVWLDSVSGYVYSESPCDRRTSCTILLAITRTRMPYLAFVQVNIISILTPDLLPYPIHWSRSSIKPPT